MSVDNDDRIAPHRASDCAARGADSRVNHPPALHVSPVSSTNAPPRSAYHPGSQCPPTQSPQRFSGGGSPSAGGLGQVPPVDQPIGAGSSGEAWTTTAKGS